LAMESDFDFDVARVATGFFFGGTEFLVKLVAFERALPVCQVGEGFEVFAQAATAHGAFFGGFLGEFRG